MELNRRSCPAKKPFSLPKILFSGVILAATIFFSGCKVGPNFHKPLPPDTERYTPLPMPAQTVSAKGPGGSAQHFVEEDIPAQWWALFHSMPLNDLIMKGIAHSPNLEAAQEALYKSQYDLRAVIGDTLLPKVDGQFSAIRQRFLGNSFGIGQGATVFSLYTAQVTASYVLDVWGGARRQVEAARADADYHYFMEEAAYLTLTSNIVTTVVNEASLRAQIAAMCELVAIEAKQLRITKQQYRLGGVSQIDVLSQETQLEQTKANLPPLQKNLEQTEHSLAVLVGELPSEAELPQFDLNCLHLPTVLPVSLPSTLVEQRPDVRASEELLHEASAQIGVATANLLPKFTLTGNSLGGGIPGANYGYQSNDLGDLFSAGNRFWSYGLSVLQPIFHGGTLIAQRRAAIAAFNQALAQYRETVLQAFQNVADALRAIDIDAHNLQTQALAEKAAGASFRLTQKQYRLGGVSYLTLLNADHQYQTARINRIQAQASRYADTAALFQALGGGWWNRELYP